MIFYDATITIPNVGSYYIGTGKMINIEISTFDRSDLQLPSWGILSNSASIEFKDTDLTFLHLAESNQLNEGAECEIRVNNTDRQSLNKIGVFKAKEWTYDNNTHTVFVSLRDNLEEWQDINVDGFGYDPSKTEEENTKNFAYIYDYLWEIVSNKDYNMEELSELNTETKNILLNSYIKYPFLEKGSLWRQWSKLCQVCQLHIYQDFSGKIICRYNGGD